MDRRKFFKDGIKGLLGNLLQENPVGQIVDRKLLGMSNILAPYGLDEMVRNSGLDLVKSGIAAEESGYSMVFPRPPGADPDSEKFEKKCNRCAECLVACPYGAIFFIDNNSGPTLNPNQLPCRLCEDYPCVQSCPTGALQEIPEDALPCFGEPRLITKNCKNSQINKEKKAKSTKGKKQTIPRYCRECVKICPVEGAIRLNKEKIPEFSESCTGCGQCVFACPEKPKAIEILW